MRSRWPAILILITICILFDFYIIGGLTQLNELISFDSLQPLYFGISIVGLVGIYLGIAQWGRSPLERGVVINWFIGFGFVSMVVKSVYALLLLLTDIWRLIEGGLAKAGVSYFANDLDTFPPDRNLTLLLIVTAVVFIPMIALIYGISFGKYKYTVERQTMIFPDLPQAFDGFKIVQISDVHSGSWDSVKQVQRGINIIAGQQADMIVFTGDMVNTNKDEIDPYIHLFAELEAPFGKYAILGNHDYYGQPREANLRPAYYEDFFHKFKQMGWDLILNDNRTISKEEESIKLLGVENWGEGRYFPKRGDLDQALQGVSKDDFTVLLSHDPTHWDHHVKGHDKHIHLTLSGHTHGMQFGINFKWLKWSPVQYRYKKWIGTYEERGQKLYINRGFGYLAFPGRVGMWPEITVITLKRGS